MDLEREEGEECEENMEVFDDSSSSPSGTLRNYPLTCKVLYSYKVRTHTELRHTHTLIFCRPPLLLCPSVLRCLNHFSVSHVLPCLRVSGLSAGRVNYR